MDGVHEGAFGFRVGVGVDVDVDSAACPYDEDESHGPAAGVDADGDETSYDCWRYCWCSETGGGALATTLVDAIEVDLLSGG